MSSPPPSNKDLADQEKGQLLANNSQPAVNTQAAGKPRRAPYDRYLLVGALVVALLLGGLGGWSALAEIAGAVIAPARVVVETKAQKVQHAHGGIVAEILVREGERVEEGQVLLRLDEVETRANLAIVEAQLQELLARQARLKAERDGSTAITFPLELMELKAQPDITRILGGQDKLFAARRGARAGQKEQLSERVEQLREEIRGLEAQRSAKVKQIDYIGGELKDLIELERKKLVPRSRVLALKREAARLEGEAGQLVAEVARARGRIGETRLRSLQIDRDAMTEVLAELRQVQTEAAELKERRLAAKTRLGRTEIHAPRTGFVHQLAVYTRGGVIAGGEPAMLIVPESDDLVVEAMVRPEDIDLVQSGQEAVVRFSAFNQRRTPELTGQVTRVSADLTQEAPNLPPYYAVRVSLAAQELAKLGDQNLKPGMPAEAFIQTPKRSVISYLTKPLTDQIQHAFRED